MCRFKTMACGYDDTVPSENIYCTPTYNLCYTFKVTPTQSNIFLAFRFNTCNSQEQKGDFHLDSKLDFHGAISENYSSHC